MRFSFCFEEDGVQTKQDCDHMTGEIDPIEDFSRQSFDLAQKESNDEKDDTEDRQELQIFHPKRILAS